MEKAQSAPLPWLPGPWDYERTPTPTDLPRPWIGRLSENRYSALACGETGTEAESNARLIAVAPELYEMLELTMAILDQTSIVWMEEEKARTIMARARGDKAPAV